LAKIARANLGGERFNEWEPPGGGTSTFPLRKGIPIRGGRGERWPGGVVTSGEREKRKLLHGSGVVVMSKSEVSRREIRLAKGSGTAVKKGRSRKTRNKRRPLKSRGGKETGWGEKRGLTKQTYWGNTFINSR